MLGRLMLVCTVFAVAMGCGGSKSNSCKKYGEMQARCSGLAQAQQAQRSERAKAMCMGSLDEKPNPLTTIDIRQESECAAKHSECAAFNACKVELKKRLNAQFKKAWQQQAKQ